MEDRDTLCYFFVFQEMGDIPKNINHPIVIFRSLGNQTSLHRSMHVGTCHKHHSTRCLVGVLF